MKRKEEYEKKWKNLPVHFLIIATEKYIIFLDKEFDLDWQTDESFNCVPDNFEEKLDYFEAKNLIDNAEAMPLLNLNNSIKLSYKRQIGEALVRLFEKDYKNAKKLINTANEFVLNRKSEESRFMLLTSTFITTSVPVFFILVLFLFKNYFELVIGKIPFIVIFSTFFASLGALVSVIYRIGKIEIDYNASKNLHYIEGFSRIIAGMISGLIVVLCIVAKVFIPVLDDLNSLNIACIIGGIIGGASERFIPSIINKLSKIN